MSDIAEELKHALELERDGDWDGAHAIVQRLETIDAYRIHAYLHRKEGDLANSGYWYNRAGEPMPDGPLEEEWDKLYASVFEEERP